MEKINKTISVNIQIFTFLSTWAIVLLASGVFAKFSYLSALANIPMAISVYVILRIVFVKWLWRCPLINGWLIKIPDIQGTWRGKLHYEYVDPSTRKISGSVDMLLVIKCTMMTKESTSHSIAASIERGTDDSLYLNYIYHNRPGTTIRYASPIHDGTAILKIIRGRQLLLKGEYWTNRYSKGEISLTYESRKIEEIYK